VEPLPTSRRTRRRRRSAVLALPIALLAACAGGASQGPTIPPDATGSVAPAATGTPAASASAVAAFPVKVTDDEGTSVEIAEEPETIVSLTPAVTETLFALGVGDRVAGRANDVYLYPPEAAPIPDVASFDAVDIEKIVSLEPDVVIAGGNFFTPQEAIDQLRSLDIPVVVVYASSVETALDDIELIGQSVGRSEESRAITDRIRTEFDAVEAAVGGMPRPRVYYEIDATGAFYAPSDKSFLAEMIDLAGAEPITTGSPDKYDIAAERLLEADPELILLADAAFGVTPEQVAARPGWDVITAVRNGDVRPIDDQTITRPGPRLFQGLQLLAATIHPDAPIPSSSPIPAVPVAP
jgi:iron complex transport system substrate-binding protein